MAKRVHYPDKWGDIVCGPLPKGARPRLSTRNKLFVTCRKCLAIAQTEHKRVHYAPTGLPEPYCARFPDARLNYTTDRYAVTCLHCLTEMGWSKRVEQLRGAVGKGKR